MEDLLGDGMQGVACGLRVPPSSSQGMATTALPLIFIYSQKIMQHSSPKGGTKQCPWS
jgi:hypothetical protein